MKRMKRRTKVWLLPVQVQAVVFVGPVVWHRPGVLVVALVAVLGLGLALALVLGPGLVLVGGRSVPFVEEMAQCCIPRRCTKVNSSASRIWR